jgi:uncharacterized protein (DUF2336 family)
MELEGAMRQGSADRRIETLRHVTDLLLHDGEQLNDDQIRVFDDVLCRLVSRVESRARAELGSRIGHLDFAPKDVIGRLARDEEIAVAGHVLTHSRRLTTNDLVEIASTRGQGHLMAISGRQHLPEAVTDVLVDRGERAVIHRLAGNDTARFSDGGFAGMLDHARNDDELSQTIGLRADLPRNFLRELLRRASDAVRKRLLAAAPPALRDEIQLVIAAIASAVGQELLPGRDFSRAEHFVEVMQQRGELTDAAIAGFAERKMAEEVAAALALLSRSQTGLIMQVLEGQRTDLVLIPCRAAQLFWPAAEAVLRHRPVRHKPDEPTLKLAERDYKALSLETAARTMRFWQVHDKTGR